MDIRKKTAAVVAAALVGGAAYGVYATTLAVSDSTKSFEAGAVSASSPLDSGPVKLDAGTPVAVFDGAEFKEYEFAEVKLTHADDSGWKTLAGKTVTVVGYDKDGKALVDGTHVIDVGDDKEISVTLTKGDANAITNWGIVIQATGK